VKNYFSDVQFTVSIFTHTISIFIVHKIKLYDTTELCGAASLYDKTRASFSIYIKNN